MKNEVKIEERWSAMIINYSFISMFVRTFLGGMEKIIAYFSKKCKKL